MAWLRPPAPTASCVLQAALAAGPLGRRGPELGALVAGSDQDELVRLAVAQGVAGPASLQLASYLAPEPLGHLLAQGRLEAAQHFNHLAHLTRFAAALEQAGVAWVVLKGPALAELAYKEAPRGYGDLDIMVPARQFHLATEALQGAGLTFAQRNWPLMARVARAQVTMAYGGTPLVDLHWDLVYKHSTRRHLRLPSDEVLGRRQRARLGNVEAWVLERTDFAAHIALHAALSGAHRLRWLLDVQRTLLSCPPDWDEFSRRCRYWGVGLPVGATLARAKATLGAPVPDGVVDELAGGRVNRELVRRLSHWVPHGHLPGGRLFSAALTRSLRDSWLATGVELSSELRQALTKLLAPRFVGPNDPRRLVDDVGGTQGFERYVALACRADRYGRLAKRDMRHARMVTWGSGQGHDEGHDVRKTPL